jgi:hypothetical protein
MQLTSVITLIGNYYLGMRNIMVNNRQKWCCPSCSQTSSRCWNLKKHIERKHQRRGQPIREDVWHSFSTNTSTATHFIPDMMSLQNNNYDLNHQRYQQTLSSASPYSKIEDTSKKRDPVYEFLEFWRPLIQEIKEMFEIINSLKEISSFSSQQPVIASLGQTLTKDKIIPPVTTTNPLQPTPTASAPAPQEQEQKKENINPLTTSVANLFITSTLIAEDLQRRARGIREDIIIDPPKLSSPTMITTTADYNNNNSKKREEEANPTIENTEEELEQDRSDIELHSSYKSSLLMDNEDDDAIIRDLDYDDSRYIEYDDDSSSDVSLVIKRDNYGNIYEWYIV